MDNLFELPSAAFSKRLRKEYEEGKHPRDNKGRWAAAAGAAAAGLVGAAALGVPGARHILPGIRRAALRTRYRAANVATQPTVLGQRVARGSDENAMRSVLSAMSARGHELPLAQAARTHYGQFSAAAQRRLARTR